MAPTTTQTAISSVLNIRPLNYRTKGEYQNSFGTFSRTVGPFGLWQVWNVVNAVYQIWLELEVQIVALLKASANDICPPRIYEGPKDPSFALRCYMVGLDQAHASPHVAIICSQKWFCTQVRDIVLVSGLLRDRGWAGFLKLPGEIRRPGGTSPTSLTLDQPARYSTSPGESWSKATYAANSEDSKLGKNDVAISLRSDTLHRTLCGTRIAVSGANGRVNIATIGGVIEIDGEAYALTASHAFLFKLPDLDNSKTAANSDGEHSVFDFDEDDLDPFVRSLPSPAEFPDTQTQPPDNSLTKAPPNESLQDIPLPLQTERPLSRTQYSNQRTLEPLNDQHRDTHDSSTSSACTNCRRATIKCDGTHPICNPCTLRGTPDSCYYATLVETEEELNPRNTKNLQSQIGEVRPTLRAAPPLNLTREPSAMSWTLGSLKTFADTPVFDYHWALISTDHELLRKARGVNYFHADRYDERLRITSISDTTIPDGSSLLLATTRGGVSATGISSKSSIKFASSNGYHSLDTVRLDCAEEGDCGSWVMDTSNGALLGMLVASCDNAHEAYILPASEIFAEIRKVSGKSVALPVGLSNRLTQSTFVKHGTGYRYDSLRTKEIRILTVSPGKPGTPIECYLSIRKLGDAGEYEALSYAWETWDPSSSINLHHHSMNVTPSLASALESLRYGDKPRTLWVDAICINQEDAEETNNQVTLMAEIMERATEVCIWLGDEIEDSQWAFSSYLRVLGIHNLHRVKSDESMLRQAVALSSLAERSWFHRRWVIQDVCRAKKATLYCGNYTMAWATFADVITLLRAYERQSQSFSDCLIQTQSRNLRNPIKDLEYLSAFIEITQSMFRRTENGLVLDSVFSLETLVCELFFLNITIPHDSIYSLLSLANDAYRLQSSPLSPLSPKPKPRDNPNLSPTVLRAISAFCKPLESRRNKLTARKHPNLSPTVLLAISVFRRSLQSRRNKLSIEVDYSKPFPEVCRDFVHMAIHGSKSLDVICRPWAPAVASLPSWVTSVSKASEITQINREFVRINANVLVGGNGKGGSRVYQASGPSHPTFHFTAQTLCVKGFIIDRVYAKKSPALMGNIPPGWMHFLGWTDTSTPAPEKVWRILVADRDLNGYLPPSYYRQACTQVFQQIKLGHGFNLSQRFRQMTPDLGLNISQELAGSTVLVREFLHRVQSVVWGRRLIKTEEHGFVGLAPEETREEDVVAILYGCSVPVILRLVSNPESRDVMFEKIGECYIDRMMDGQALDIKESMGTKTETFMIV